MRLATRILFGLSGFLALAAAVYWVMSYQGASRDPAGPALMGIAGVAFGYTGLVLWAAARRADREAAAEHATENRAWRSRISFRSSARHADVT